MLETPDLSAGPATLSYHIPIMKFNSVTAAVAASFLSSGGLVAASPLKFTHDVVVVEPSKFEVSVLGGNTLKIKQVYNKGFISAHRGPRALAKAYNKFGVELSTDLLDLLNEILEELGLKPAAGAGTNETANADQGEVSAVPQLFDSEYLAEVQIGTPPQTVNLDFDTGSSDLWVFSSDTPKTQVAGQKLYNVNASSSAVRVPGATWSIRYGDGSGSSGIVYTDTVSIGGVTVQNQAIESATQVSASFTNDTASSGLLGLAFDAINTVKPSSQKTFFSNAMENLAMPLFTANLKQAEGETLRYSLR